MTFDNLLLSIGAAKCGTTWLHRALAQHPEISSAPVKELNYFTVQQLGSRWLEIHKRLIISGRLLDYSRDNAVRSANTARGPQNVQKHLDELEWFRIFLEPEVNDEWFIRLFESIPGKYMVDFGNQNFRLQGEHLAQIKSQTENLKVLYTVRKPSKRLWSHVRFHLEQIGDDVGAVADMSRDEFINVVREHSIDVHGGYAQVIKKLQTSLDPEDVKICIFEDLVNDPATAMTELESFLGIASIDYDMDRLKSKINVSSSSAPNPAIAEYLEEVDQQQIARLERVGFELPARWLA